MGEGRPSNGLEQDAPATFLGCCLLIDEFQFVGFSSGFVGFLPLGGGGEFAGRRGLAFFQKSVGAENDTVGIPESDEPEAADGFELKEAVTEGVDLLFVLGEPMFAGVIEELGEFGEFVG